MQRELRRNIRNAWLAENSLSIREEAINRAAQGKWYECSCLMELALDIIEEEVCQ